MSSTSTLAYRQLLAALAFFLVTHIAGLITMAWLLLPGFDPGTDVALRVLYLREHALAWRWGWLPWQLSAASDAWLTIALFRWSLARKQSRAVLWCALALVCFVGAVIPEQYAEFQLARQHTLEKFPLYLWLTGTWANSAYVLMTACWMLALRRHGASVWPAWAESGMLALFTAAGIANHFAWWGAGPDGGSVNAFRVSSAFNGLAFPALLVYGAGMAARVGDLQLTAARTAQCLPAPLRWHAPVWLPFHWLVQAASSPGLRDLLRVILSPLPFPKLRSDVQDVVYLNWLVSADALEALLPEGTRVERFGEHAVLSVLVFRHGHFGPAFLGPARSLLPSPVQCNVRAYLATPEQHVVFLSNSVGHAVYCLGARLLSDGLPAHHPASARCERVGSELLVQIEPAAGSALALNARVSECDDPQLSAAFRDVFGDAGAALRYLVPQNAAVRFLPTIGAHCVSSIVVQAGLESARWAKVNGAVHIGAPLDALVRAAEPFAFILPSARFEVLSERMH